MTCSRGRIQSCFRWGIGWLLVSSIPTVPSLAQTDPSSLIRTHARMAIAATNTSPELLPPLAIPDGLRQVVEPFHYPLSVKAPISSGLGMRVNPVTGKRQFHYGVDLAAAYGTPILAAFSGQVLFARDYGGLGRVVILGHANEQVTRYGHMSRFVVGEGQQVQQGEVIGYVGSTGQSQGPHLHFEWWQRRGPKDSDWVVLDSSVLLN